VFSCRNPSTPSLVSQPTRKHHYIMASVLRTFVSAISITADNGSTGVSRIAAPLWILRRTLDDCDGEGTGEGWTRDEGSGAWRDPVEAKVEAGWSWISGMLWEPTLTLLSTLLCPTLHSITTRRHASSHSPIVSYSGCTTMTSRLQPSLS
jgi:hypothetical protein